MSIRCGVAGLGRGSSFVNWINELDGCEVVAVCDENPKALERFSGLDAYTSYEAMIDSANLDMVAVITPGPQHAPQALYALEAGVNVLSETPCVYSLEEAKSIVETVRRTGCKYMLAEDYIWMGWTQSLKRLLDEGRLGDIVFAEGEYTHDCRGSMLRDSNGAVYPASAWGTRDDLTPAWRASDLPPLFYCSHTLGPLFYLLNDRGVSAVGMHTGGKLAPDVCPVDMESGLVKTEAGRVVRLTNGFCIAHPFSLFTGFYGTRGSIRMVNLGGLSVKAWFEDNSGGDWEELPIVYHEREDGRHWVSVMLDDYFTALRNDTAPPVDEVKSMEYTLPGICCHMSAEQGGATIEIPDLR